MFTDVSEQITTFIFNREDGGSTFLRNVDKQKRHIPKDNNLHSHRP
jgi:hypothetical protein